MKNNYILKIEFGDTDIGIERAFINIDITKNNNFPIGNCYEGLYDKLSQAFKEFNCPDDYDGISYDEIMEFREDGFSLDTFIDYLKFRYKWKVKIIEHKYDFEIELVDRT